MLLLLQLPRGGMIGATAPASSPVTRNRFEGFIKQPS
jgi:hypothetical protein